MTTDMKRRGAHAGPTLIHNSISMAGVVLAASSFFAVACLIALDFFRGFANPYLGILTYIVAPLFLIAGLLLISAGVLLERHRRRSRKPGEIPEFPRLDFNDPRQRRRFVVISVVTAAFLLLTALGSYRTYEFTESVAFCGETCHSIMQPEFTAYQESAHARVMCVQCHIGPGASWYVKSKLSGAYQVYATIVDKYPRPIPTPIENLRPARETCEQCHWPREFFGASERTFQHFLPDEQNSPWTIQMLIKVGGGDPSFGVVGGIHLHMAIANKVEYIAADTARQDIRWVRLTDEEGAVTVYQSSDRPLTAAQVAASQPRVMDCIDCHNRPAHAYSAPVPAVNLALETGRMSRAVPHIKEQASLALGKRYASASEAETRIASELTAYYKSKYATFADSNAALIAGAVAETQRIYRQNFFPAMKVDWRVYPDNIGHMAFPGCFRCHDGSMKSVDGKVITHQCDTCHLIISQGPTEAQASSVTGLDFKHPADIGEDWKGSNCTDCHDGTIVD